MLRAWTTIARDSRVGPGLPSITSASAPRRCSTRPAISPVGPAPTTSTSVSSGGVVSMADVLSTRRRVDPDLTVDLRDTRGQSRSQRGDPHGAPGRGPGGRSGSTTGEGLYRSGGGAGQPSASLLAIAPCEV